MDRIPILWKISIHFNVVHRKMGWRNPKLKSLKDESGQMHSDCPGLVSM